MTGCDLSVVVPVYNNAATLDELIDRLLQVVDTLGLRVELIFVDDGSTDASVDILRQRAAREPRLRVAPLTRNFGGQAAMCAGFDLVRGRRTVCLDADLENYPEDIPVLLAALNRGADLACGVREQRGGQLFRRRLPSRLLNAYVRRVVGTSVRDIGCGMRAMDSALIHNLAAAGERRRLLTPLLLSRATRIVEVPIRHTPARHPGGHSFLTLLGIAMDFYLLTAKRPFLISATVSAIAVVASLSLAVVAAARGSALLALASLALLLSGLLGGLISLLGEYAQRLYQMGQQLPFYELQATEPDRRRPRSETRHEQPLSREG